MKSLILAVAILALAGCSALKKQGPSDVVPVIDSFNYQAGPLEFSIKTTGATRCEILPTIGDVSCNGQKAWPKPTTPTTYTLFAYGNGQSAKQATVAQ